MPQVPLEIPFAERSYLDLLRLCRNTNGRVRAALDSIAPEAGRVRLGSSQKGAFTPFRTRFLYRIGWLRGVEVELKIKHSRLILEVEANPPLLRFLLGCVGVVLVVPAVLMLYALVSEDIPAGRAGMPVFSGLAGFVGVAAILPLFVLFRFGIERLYQRCFPAAWEDSQSIATHAQQLISLVLTQDNPHLDESSDAQVVTQP